MYFQRLFDGFLQKYIFDVNPSYFFVMKYLQNSHLKRKVCRNATISEFILQAFNVVS